MNKYTAKIAAIKSEIVTNDMEAYAALVRFNGNIVKAIHHIQSRRFRHELAKRNNTSREASEDSGSSEQNKSRDEEVFRQS